MPRSKHFLDMLVVSFQLAPSLIVLITCKLTHYQNFHCSYYDFMQGHSLSSLTIQVALMLHGLVSTQALLIFLVHIQWSCCSLPRLLQLLTSHVTLRGEGGHMHETNWIFEQTPPSHFYLKVVCKRGEYIKAKITTLKIQSNLIHFHWSQHARIKNLEMQTFVTLQIVCTAYVNLSSPVPSPSTKYHCIVASPEWGKKTVRVKLLCNDWGEPMRVPH